MTEPQFEQPGEAPTESVAEPTGERRGRGRPRTQETLARDERVKEALRSGPKTREQLATELDDRPSLVYLALWRLARANAVVKTADGESRHAWRLVD